jgi:hypothetical protein
MKTKSRRGGFLGSLINQSVVPLTLLGLQQTYHKKRHGGKRTRKYKGGRKTYKHR